MMYAVGGKIFLSNILVLSRETELSFLWLDFNIFFVCLFVVVVFKP